MLDGSWNVLLCVWSLLSRAQVDLCTSLSGLFTFVLPPRRISLCRQFVMPSARKFRLVLWLVPDATYTMGHKKRATLFWTITPMFLGGFFTFLEPVSAVLVAGFTFCLLTEILTSLQNYRLKTCHCPGKSHRKILEFFRTEWVQTLEGHSSCKISNPKFPPVGSLWENPA